MPDVTATIQPGGTQVSVRWNGFEHVLMVDGGQIVGSTATMWFVLRTLAFALHARVEAER